MTHAFRTLTAAGLGVLMLTIPASASDPMGAYCLIDKVVLEPGECPDRAQIWGACALANRYGYQTPTRGYFYYSIPTGQEDTARREWLDLKAVAGTQEAIGFGGRNRNMGRFRGLTEAPTTPDAYPLNIGVIRLRDSIWQGTELLQQLKAARERR
jgi:hypothetical protein